MKYHGFSYISLAILLSVAPPSPRQPRDKPSCHATIVSDTVISTFCGHASGEQQYLDLLILWRGTPDWFQRREKGSNGEDVTRDFASGEGARVAEYRTFAGVTVGFDADFAARTVTIDGDTLSLAHDNIIVVDHVDFPYLRHVTTTFRVERTLLPLGDANLVLARISARILDAFQCTPHVPSPRRGPFRQPQRGNLGTVCERLRS
jgi:hypothetical protein